METKLRFNFIDLPLKLVISLEKDSNGDEIKSYEYGFKVKDFMFVYTHFIREKVFHISKQDLVIRGKDLNGCYLDIWLDGCAGDIRYHPWMYVNSGDKDLDEFIMKELIKQNLK